MFNSNFNNISVNIYCGGILGLRKKLKYPDKSSASH